MPKKNHREDEIQRACIRYCKYQYPQVLAFHVPNGGWRSKIEASIMKGLGVMAGVSDILILHPAGKYHGMAVEVKTEKGKLSEHQKDFLRKCDQAGYKTAVIRSTGEFIEQITRYMTQT